MHAVLDRHGLVKRRKRRRYRAEGTPLQDVKQPNALWCADYKGEFKLANKSYCYPLTAGFAYIKPVTHRMTSVTGYVGKYVYKEGDIELSYTLARVQAQIPGEFGST